MNKDLLIFSVHKFAISSSTALDKSQAKPNYRENNVHWLGKSHLPNQASFATLPSDSNTRISNRQRCMPGCATIELYFGHKLTRTMGSTHSLVVVQILLSGLRRIHFSSSADLNPNWCDCLAIHHLINSPDAFLKPFPVWMGEPPSMLGSRRSNGMVNVTRPFPLKYDDAFEDTN